MTSSPWVRLSWFALLVIVGLGFGFTLASLDPRRDQRAIVLIGLSMAVLVPLMIVLTVVLLRSPRRGPDTRYLADSILLVQAGHSAQVLARARALRRDGDRSAENALVLANACVAQAQGAQAELFAREALAILAGQAVCERDDSVARWLCDLAHITLYNALMARGAFAQAAESLRPRAPHAEDITFIHTLIAWGLFLARQEEAAGTVLDALPPTTRAVRHLGDRYALALVHMRYQLRGEPSPDLRRYAEAVREWCAEADRHAHTAYGARLRALLRDWEELAAG
ncbi:MAG: hypothetical protein Kow00106_04120 [Anaerolineae bacterium]